MATSSSTTSWSPFSAGEGLVVARLTFASNRSPLKIFSGKAHRRKQSEGVVSYVELLSRRIACIASSPCRLACIVQLPHEEISAGLTKDRDKIFKDKAYRRKQSAGVVTYVKLLSRNNAVFGNFSRSETVNIF